MTDVRAGSIDAAAYRKVLGQYPTGVCVITAKGVDGEPVAMVVGSFSSVSLSPPLVGFFPDKGSSSWAKLRTCRHFCVNILSARQEEVCRKLASKDPDKFSGTPHSLSMRGVPLLHDVVARIECEMDTITDAGDHDLVFGRVIELDVVSGALPLLFFQGGYGAFSPASMALADTKGLTPAQLRQVNHARPVMEALAARTGGHCIATQRIGGELVVSGSAGQGQRGIASSLVGQRLPFVPPTGSVFGAWLEEDAARTWLVRGPADGMNDRRAALERVRTRGFSLGLLDDAHRVFVERVDELAARGEDVYPEDLERYVSGLAYDPAELDEESCRAIRVISAPVFGERGEVVLALTLFDFAKPQGPAGVREYIEAVVDAAARLSPGIGNPGP